MQVLSHRLGFYVGAQQAIASLRTQGDGLRDKIGGAHIKGRLSDLPAGGDQYQLGSPGQGRQGQVGIYPALKTVRGFGGYSQAQGSLADGRRIKVS